MVISHYIEIYFVGYSKDLRQLLNRLESYARNLKSIFEDFDA